MLEGTKVRLEVPCRRMREREAIRAYRVVSEIGVTVVAVISRHLGFL